MKFPKLMGILNLTPDSFSDGGKFNNMERAIARAIEIENSGAEILDIGGESTGPNSKDVSEQVELRRVIPTLKEIQKRINIEISVDTSKSKVAQAALKNGATIINDITGLRGDEYMAETIAEHESKVVIMYAKDGTPRTTIMAKKYKDVIKTISDFFEKRIAYAVSKGIKRKNIILDPGFGHFISSIPSYSYQIIAELPNLKKFGLPILLGISRKSALGGALEDRDKRGLPLNAVAYLQGADILRVHKVKETKEFLSNLF
ncbi:dihydropteroate synthase [Candidatus Peregrinibacteria bacterium]|nr:dihydropteroate synthase [Candidatus Peregrinibacteria bacterium]